MSPAGTLYSGLEYSWLEYSKISIRLKTHPDRTVVGRIYHIFITTRPITNLHPPFRERDITVNLRRLEVLGMISDWHACRYRQWH
jgi:hypothetical protein